MKETKQCLYCKRFFEKKYHYSQRYWDKRKFCSRDCADKARKGEHFSLGTEFKKGNAFGKHQNHRKGKDNNFWKGGQIELKCEICGKEFKVDLHRKDIARFCSVECRNRFKRLLSSRKRMKDIQKLRVRNGLHNLYRGATEERKLIRKSAEYKEWRKRVFERENYTCWICGENGILHPHHLKSFSKYPKLRLDVNNGLTLCEFCHRTYTDFGKHSF